MKYAEAYRHREADVILFEIEDSVPFADKDRVRAHLLEVHRPASCVRCL